jgi:hypothetical protein
LLAAAISNAVVSIKASLKVNKKFYKKIENASKLGQVFKSNCKDPLNFLQSSQ